MNEPSVADLLAFEGWPTEMQEIAEKALRGKLAREHDREVNEAMEDASGEQEEIDRQRYERVMKWVARAKEHLSSGLAEVREEECVGTRSVESLAEGLAILDTLPSRLADVSDVPA